MLAFDGKNASELSLGYAVDVHAFTGGSALTVPVPAPEGRDGIAPELVLAYSSGGGNSAFGAGWSLAGLPAVTINTRHHVPRWDGSDGFQLGGDELVPWLVQSSGAWVPRGFTSGDWSVAFYRSRRGNAKTRAEKWLHVPSGRVHFRSRDAFNRITVYGARPSAAARIADTTSEDRTYAWLPECIIDPRGNVLWIEYAAETLDGIDLVSSFERLTPSLTQRYLKRISYGNLAPITFDDALVAGQLPANTTWCFQVVLDYGDHGDPDIPAATPDRVWPVRLDPYSTYSCGFEVRTYRLCRRFLAFHNFSELGPSPRLIDALVLSHDEEPAGSVLTQLVRIGYRWDNGVVTSAALPALKMAYAPPLTDQAFSDVPQQSAANVPAGLAAGPFTLTDLFGEGLAGILYRDNRTWYYKANRGQGVFGSQQLVAQIPAAARSTFVCADLDADGNTEFAQLGGRNAGVYELDREDDRWKAFRPFAAFPHVEAFGGHARWIDLNGDRRPDVVVSKGDGFTWFASDGDAFSAPVDLPRPDGLTPVPTLADDLALDFLFADMTGDGLSDLVRIRNGSITYWPALGNGSFGDAVVMEGVPRFASDEEFDASRVRLVDLDGSGTTDIVYIGRGEVTCWINATGNQLFPGPRLEALPHFDNLSNVRVSDFLGDGSPCLVWSSPLPGQESPLNYLRLGPSVRPRLLVSVDDSFGRVTKLTYSSSARHYLRDVASGRGWTTRLPGHHPVVDRCEVTDGIAKTRSVRSFEYHDGFYDGKERELRGFGQVDIYDSDLADQSPASATSAAVAPPALERCWYHVGTPMWDFGQATFYAGDQQLPVLSPHVVDNADLLSADEIEDGLRSLAGEVVRRELYAVDTTGAIGVDPLQVVQRRTRLSAAQPASGPDRPAFTKTVAEQATWSYEQSAADPRVAHTISITTDSYGQPIRDVEIGYARRGTAEIDAQSRHHVRVADHAWIVFDEANRYELGIPAESKSFELAGLRPSGPTFTREQFLAKAVNDALAAPGRHDLDPLDDPVQGSKARILTWEQTFYWDDARAKPLAFGVTGAVTLLHHEEAACFEPTFVSDVYGDRVDDALLTQLGYTARDGFWWQADETHTYLGPQQFFQHASLVRGDGATTSFGYDGYALERTTYTDAMKNTIVAEVDYCRLAPWRITDPNGTVNEVRYDPLGVIVAATTYGHVGAQPWGFDPLSAVVPKTPANLADAVANAAVLVQGARHYAWYDLHAWSQTGKPTTQLTMTREELVHDGAGGGVAQGPVQIAVLYSDSLGRTLQEKTLVEPGPAITRDGAGAVILDAVGIPVMADAQQRWHASGRTMYDAKERPARAFEPFFTTTPEYEGDKVLQTLGASTLTRYDVTGRVAGQDFANGSFGRTIYKPWSVEQFDPNDTVLDSAYGAARANLPAGDPQRQAYEEAVPHANTMRIAYLDPLARESGVLAKGGATAADQMSQSHLDLHGRQKEVVDPRGLTAFRTRYDMQGTPVEQQSIDAGELRRLSDAYGRETHLWDGRGFAIMRGFDALDRPLFIDVTGGDGPTPLDHRVEQWIYGESLPDYNDAIARNLLGHVAITCDGAQQLTVDQCDPGGRVLSISRRLRSVVDAEPDWRTTVALEPQMYVETAVFDGLERVRSDVLADGTTRSYSYTKSSLLTKVTVATPDGSIKDVPILSGTQINARGQRLAQTFGNGVQLQYGYDPATFRLATQTASRSGKTFQQIGYTYDPVGNIVRITDAAQEGPTALISGLAVPARRDYVYDAHYRLRQASGRVHQALLQNDFVPGSAGTVKGTRHIGLNNGAAIERFTRTYDFDPSGNLVSIKHAGTSQNWTTPMWISPTSNRSLPALDLNGVPVANPEASFDAAGNQVALQHLRGLEWNWRSSLTRAVVIARPDGPDDAERYVYGADGLRVRKVTTRVLQNNVVEVTEKVYFNDLERKRIIRAGSVVLERWSVHVSDGNERIALVHRWTKDDAAREVDDVTKVRVHYQLTTHQASVAIELDESGALISYEEYFPYGGTSFIAGDDLREIEIKDYKYSGKERDDFTGLHAYGYRYYAPWIGRWLSPDPSGPVDDLNLYQFVLGDPVGSVDADGLDGDDGKIRYYTVERPDVHQSDEACIVATRASLSPQQARLFDSLDRTQQADFSCLGVGVLVAKDLEDLSAGGALLAKRDFNRIYLPKIYQPWAREHHRAAEIWRIQDGDELNPVSTVAVPREGNAADTAGDAGNAGGDEIAGRGSSSQTSTNAPAAGQTPSRESEVCVNQADGAGLSTSGSSDPALPGLSGDQNSSSRDENKSSNASRTGKKDESRAQTSSIGALGGSLFTDIGGREQCIPGETPFGTSTSSDERGNPISDGSVSNGSENDANSRIIAGMPSGIPDSTGQHRDNAAVRSGRGRGGGSGAPGGSGGASGFEGSGGAAGFEGAGGAAGFEGTGGATSFEGSGGAAALGGAGGAADSGRTGAGGAPPSALGSAWEQAVKIAGYLNFEFDQNNPNAKPGGIPGGSGDLFSGKLAQFAYVAFTVIDTALIFGSIWKSIAKGVLKRSLRALTSPRMLMRALKEFLKEGKSWLRDFWKSGPVKRFWSALKRLFFDPRKFPSVRAARNKSFWRPRWFSGTLARVGNKSLYTWEHIIPQVVGEKYPRLRPFINSYLNSGLRLPGVFNSQLQDRFLPKAFFYYGAARGVQRSGQLGWAAGKKIVLDNSPRVEEQESQ